VGISQFAYFRRDLALVTLRIKYGSTEFLANPEANVVPVTLLRRLRGHSNKLWWPS
jgi:hypothetical protein